MLAWTLIEFVQRNWAMAAFGFTLASLLLVPIWILWKYSRISLNIMRSTKPPLSFSPLDYDRLEGETVTFPAADGQRLAGMIIRADPSAPRRGMIIFAHEYCADMHSCARYCRPLRDIGYDVFSFDFRGHGQSPGEPDYEPRQWVTEREVHDMRGAVAWVEAWLDERGLPRQIGVFGISRGASAAILAAAADPRIHAIVSDGGFSTDTTIEYFMRRWAYIFARVRVVYENHHPAFWRLLRWTMMHFARREFRCRFPSVRKAIQRMTPRPMLFIHGERDSYLPVEASRRLYALAGQPKHLWIAPGAKHNQAVIVHPERYARLVIDFFDRYLAGAARPADAAPPAASRSAAGAEPVARA